MLSKALSGSSLHFQPHLLPLSPSTSRPRAWNVSCTLDWFMFLGHILAIIFQVYLFFLILYKDTQLSCHISETISNSSSRPIRIRCFLLWVPLSRDLLINSTCHAVPWLGVFATNSKFPRKGLSVYFFRPQHLAWCLVCSRCLLIVLWMKEAMVMLKEKMSVTDDKLL